MLPALVALRVAVARWLLTRPSDALRARADQVATSRRSAVRAEAQVLRRLERDLHDGPQQRLVRLGMDRESAGRRLDDPDGDPQRARTLVAEALTQSREALAELRALSRGIAPPILADRGLAPALAAAAARSPVAVSLDVTVPDRPRPPAAVENAAYFVVTEALTNVALKDRVARLADLSDALERVANGRTVLDPEVVAALFAQRRRRDAIASLSPRERQVIGLMAEGRTNGAIGRMLVVGPGAVEKHISSIFTKLGLPPSGDDHRRVLAVVAWLTS